MGKKVLMLLSNEYGPDVRVQKEAKALADGGYQVEVLAWNRSMTRPAEEKDQGSLIVRIQAGRYQGKLGLVVGFPIFILRSILRGLREDADVVHAHDLDTLFHGVMISKIKRAPLVYDAHEHYARMVEQDIPKWAASWLDRMEARLVRRADLVIAANTKIAEYLGRVAKRLVVVMNCADQVPATAVRVEEDGGQLIILYAGSLEPLRFIEELMEAVSKDDRMQFRIAGSGTLQAKVEGMARTHANIGYLGRLSRDEVGVEMARSDAVVALLDPSNENNRIGTPNRLFEAMAAGVPVLVSAGTLSAEIAEECGCGIVVDWEKGGLEGALPVLMEPMAGRRMGENGRKAFETKYNWARMSAVLVDAYRDLPIGAGH